MRIWRAQVRSVQIRRSDYNLREYNDLTEHVFKIGATRMDGVRDETRLKTRIARASLRMCLACR